MTTTLSSESANWVLPSYPTTLPSTLHNYEESLPIRVNREGVKNYIKHRGTLNLGDWATEGRRMSTSSITLEPNVFAAPPPKVLGPDAMRNYIRSRSSTPNLIHGTLDAPNPHTHFRVKKEARANYEQDRNSQMKTLFSNYGKFPLPPPPAPHTQGKVATNLFYTNQEGHMGPLFGDYGRAPLSARPNPHVKGDAAETNLRKSQGDSRIFRHSNSYRSATPEPHVTGVQAQLNYDMGHGRQVDKLFHQYGKLPQSARTVPKVKYDGVQNFEHSQGDGMRKAISQCPPSMRCCEQLQPVPSWP